MKVKFRPDNREIYAEVAATRLYWALGFYADAMHPVRLECTNCPEDPVKGVWWRAAVPVAVGLGLVLVPPPAGLAPNAWSYFALFAVVVVGLILERIPAAAIGLVGVTVAGVGRLVAEGPAASITWALSGFQYRTVWLIFGAFVFSIGYGKTGLGRRVALWLVRGLDGDGPSAWATRSRWPTSPSPRARRPSRSV